MKKKIEKEFLKLKNAAIFLDMSVNTFKAHILPNVRFKRVGNNLYIYKQDLINFMLDKTDNSEIQIKAQEIASKILTHI